mgnify:FL=1
MELEAKLDSLKFEIQEEPVLGTKIKVIGVGGGGSNAVGRMMAEGLSGVEFHIMNTDVQALQASAVPNKLALGMRVTNGLGAGADPDVGRRAALEETERIIEILEGSDMVFVTAGLGGGTGTGAAPVVASLAKELNALTVAVVTRPFGFEGPRRMKQAEKGLAELAATVDTVISIPNDRLLELVPRGTSFLDAFRVADDVLRQAVQGIADIITTPGLINRDFSDIRNIMLGMGFAMMGTATAEGENAAVEAARQAISCPLLEEGGVKGAKGMLINITGSSKLGLHEVNEACSLIRAAADNDEVQINFGVVMDEAMGDKVKITVLATGFKRENLPSVQKVSVGSAAGKNGEKPTRRERAAAEPAPSIFDQPEPEEQPVVEAAASEAEPEATAEFELQPQPEPEPENFPKPDDLDTPAFLRRERRSFQ